MSWGAKFPKCRDARAGCPRPAGDRGSVGAEEARRGAASCFPARGEQVVGGAARRGERGRRRTKWRRGRDGEGGRARLGGAERLFSAVGRCELTACTTWLGRAASGAGARVAARGAGARSLREGRGGAGHSRGAAEDLLGVCGEAVDEVVPGAGVDGHCLVRVGHAARRRLDALARHVLELDRAVRA